MPVQILMPALSPTMTEGTLAKWIKAEGDAVKAGDVIAEIETDKATMEVEAVDEGILAKILVAAGTGNVKVNALIAVLLEEGEDASSLATFMQSSAGLKSASSEAPQIQASAAKAQPSAVPSPLSQAGVLAPLAAGSEKRIFASPLARRIAQQTGVDLSKLRGTGPRGRIIKADIEGSTAQKKSTLSFDNVPDMPAYRAEPVSSIRTIIAQRLTASKQTIPHFYLSIDVEMDALLKLREGVNQAQSAVKVSVNDMLIKAVAKALMEVPQANAAWADSEIRYYETADISVAVAIEGGLVTPIVRQADLKPLLSVSQEMKKLAEDARLGKLKPVAWQGGTFTISNLGMFGIQQFQAILNPPQACILAVGSSERKPVVRGDDKIEIATLMRLSLSADHRVVDGAVGAKFLSALRVILQNPVCLVL